MNCTRRTSQHEDKEIKRCSVKNWSLQSIWQSNLVVYPLITYPFGFCCPLHKLGHELSHYNFIFYTYQWLNLFLFYFRKRSKTGVPFITSSFSVSCWRTQQSYLRKRSVGSFPGIKISQALHLTQLLFVDDVLIFRGGSKREVEVLRNILSLFSK